MTTIDRIGFLTTRVGRRLLGHFLGAALLPVLAVAIVGFWTVHRTVTDDAQERVTRLAKAAALTLLGALDAERMGAAALSAEGLPSLPPLSDDARAHMLRGEPLLIVHAAPDGQRDAALEFVRSSRDGRLTRQRLDAAHLWSALSEVVQGERSEFCVFAGRDARRVRCSEGVTSATVARLRGVAQESEGNGGATVAADFVFGNRQLFMRYSYGADEWRLVAAESTAQVLAPLGQLRTTLLLLVALAVVVAFMLAHRQIRQSTEPLVQLRAGTSRVAAGDLETPVVIAAGDEYAELGDAFNAMTGTLSNQLALLHRMDAIDEAALRERQQAAIVGAAVGHLCGIRSCSRVMLAIHGESNPDQVDVTWIDPAAPRPRQLQATWTTHERLLLLAAPRIGTEQARTQLPLFASLPTLRSSELRFANFPLVHDEELLGVLSLASSSIDGFTADELADVRRVADRVTMGLANTKLVERLQALSLGAMRAFATAIDANSPWTAGHSERVTTVSLALARQLGCSAVDLDTLARGCLLHDIGKIGVPTMILDKPGRLTAEERALIERHPVIGVEILAPLPVFSSVLPIVRSHHERVDGAGYPDRLVGEAIPWLARITAVADVFDALTSERPYRKGLSLEQTLAMIVADAGSAFDPRVVDALLALHAAGALPEVRSTTSTAAAEAPLPSVPPVLRIA
jgi:putative nucleotidyltransferase with HDIG domain